MFERNDRPAYTYRSSKNTLGRMTAIRLGPTHVELVVHPSELVIDGGAGFRSKFRSALGDSPKTLVLNLTAASGLDAVGSELLVEARREAESRGIRMVVRPSNPAAKGRLEELGLSALMSAAA